MIITFTNSIVAWIAYTILALLILVEIFWIFATARKYYFQAQLAKDEIATNNLIQSLAKDSIAARLNLIEDALLKRERAAAPPYSKIMDAEVQAHFDGQSDMLDRIRRELLPTPTTTQENDF